MRCFLPHLVNKRKKINIMLSIIIMANMCLWSMVPFQLKTAVCTAWWQANQLWNIFVKPQKVLQPLLRLDPAHLGAVFHLAVATQQVRSVFLKFYQKAHQLLIFLVALLTHIISWQPLPISSLIKNYQQWIN